MRKRGGRESRALAVHITLLTTGSMPPRPSRGPTSLHLASLGSPFALLTGLCPPPPRFAAPLCRTACSPSAFSHPTAPRPLASLATRARARDQFPPFASRLPSCAPFPSSTFSVSAASLARLDLTFPAHPVALSSCFCSLFLLVRPHRAFSSTVRVRERTPYRLVSLDSFVHSFLSFSSPCSSSSSSFPLLSFRLLLSFRGFFFFFFFVFFLRSSHATLFPFPSARRKLFQKFVLLLLLSLDHSPRTATRVLESPVQCELCSRPVDCPTATTSRGRLSGTSLEEREKKKKESERQRRGRRRNPDRFY